MNAKSNYVVIDKYTDILMYLDYNSQTLFNLVRENKSENRFHLLRKYLTHSDIANKGKPTKTQKAALSEVEYRKNFILYYDSLAELLQLEKLPTAAQSNIGMPEIFYELLGIRTYQQNNRRQYVINNKWGKYIPKDALVDFNYSDFAKIQVFNEKNSFTNRTIDILSNFPFEHFEEEKLPNFYKIDQLTIAAHGLGTDDDKLLKYFRSLAFKGDVINILLDKNKNNLYIFFERNEKYFELKSKIEKLDISPPIWKEYTEEDKKAITLLLFSLDKTEGEVNSEIINVIDESHTDDAEINTILVNYFSEYNKTIDKILSSGEKPKYRWYQRKWREVLIKLDEVAFHSKGYAFCAISGLKGKYEKLGRFFIASHIKPYSDCIADSDYHAAFDPHNGLILSANVDALFDQHLITIDVDKDGEILKKPVVGSISRIGNIIYKDKLNVQYLTNERKEYLRLHKMKFESK
ncbi:MAG: HNH endonuclease signature motif containing protein [Bacilli bacterium]